MVELEVTRLAVGGAGVARSPDGRVVLCEGSLPGERVEARVVAERRDFLLAQTVSVVRASPARTEPACPHVARGCGGCTFAYVETGASEVALKAAIVADALHRIARLPDPAVVAVPASVPGRGYRTTLRLAVDDDGRPAFRRRHTTELLSVTSCLVAHPRLEQLVVTGRFEGATEVLLRVGVAGGERVACPDRRPRRVTVPPDVHNLGDLRGSVRVGEVAALADDLPGADIVIADPPRAGLGPSAARAVASIGASVVVLISCNPASLARDTRLLTAAGYDLGGVEVVDAFPSTFHVETVSRFRAAR